MVCFSTTLKQQTHFRYFERVSFVVLKKITFILLAKTHILLIPNACMLKSHTYMKKIYWWIQQLNRLGGTEMVTVDIINGLVDKYDITLLTTVDSNESIPYQINPRVKVMSLGIPQRCEQYEHLSKRYLSHFRIFSYLFLVLQIFFHFVLRKRHYRKVVEEMIIRDDATLICGAIDSYMLAPKKGKVYFHYHFSSEYLFKNDKFFLKHARRPDKWIFLCKTTRDELLNKAPHLYSNSTYIYNPTRFESVLDTHYNDNTILFVGRYSEVKNPLLALKIAKELKERNFSFKLNMFGDGPLKDELRNYVTDNNLNDVVIVNDFMTDIKEELLHSDILLVTSKSEGFSLAMSESNACSRPWVSTYWGNIIKERIVEGRNGVVIKSEDPKDFADEIISLLSDKDKLTSMKKASYEESKRFSKDAIINEWAKLLK